MEQIEEWKNQLEEFTSEKKIEVPNSIEYASQIINSVWTDNPSTIYGNISNKGFIPDLPEGCAVEVPCIIDAQGIHPNPSGTTKNNLKIRKYTAVNHSVLHY